MKSRTKIIIAGSAALLAFGGIALAAKGYSERGKMKRLFSPQSMIERFDTNSDQAISMEEISGALTARFAAADLNKDNLLSREEVVANINENVEAERVKRHSDRIANRILKSADIDQDGSITQAQVENRVRKVHALADWNDDGNVELAEMQRLGESLRGRRGKSRN